MSDSMLIEWIQGFYGQRKLYPTARQLALAISDSRNQNAVSDIETKGIVSLQTLKGVARATKTNPLQVMLIAGWVSEDEIKEFANIEDRPLSLDETLVLQEYQAVPDDLKPLALQVVRALREQKAQIPG